MDQRWPKNIKEVKEDIEMEDLGGRVSSLLWSAGWESSLMQVITWEANCGNHQQEILQRPQSILQSGVSCFNKSVSKSTHHTTVRSFLHHFLPQLNSWLAGRHCWRQYQLRGLLGNRVLFMLFLICVMSLHLQSQSVRYRYGALCVLALQAVLLRSPLWPTACVARAEKTSTNHCCRQWDKKSTSVQSDSHTSFGSQHNSTFFVKEFLF